jgi:hypothetical protein
LRLNCPSVVSPRKSVPHLPSSVAVARKTGQIRTSHNASHLNTSHEAETTAARWAPNNTARQKSPHSPVTGATDTDGPPTSVIHMRPRGHSRARGSSKSAGFFFCCLDAAASRPPARHHCCFR